MFGVREINKGIKRNTVLSETDFSDRRHKSTMVLDVETTMGAGNERTIFDIGWTISVPSKKQMVMHRSYVIAEVFLDMKVMKRAHYFEKYSQYMLGLINGSVEMVSWEYVKQMLDHDIRQFNVNNILAYNAGFDKGALKDTQAYLNAAIGFDLEIKCLMVAAIDKVMSKPGYIKVAYALGWFTDGGNIATNAESMYRFISKEYEFIESHTGLEDSIIETYILWYVHALGGSRDYTIGAKDWRTVEKVAKEMNMLGPKKPKVKKPKEWLKLSNAKSQTVKLKGKIIEVIVTDTEPKKELKIKEESK